MKHEKHCGSNDRGCCSCLFWIAIIALIWTTYTGAFPRAIGGFLMKTDNVEQADLIYVFAGGTIERPGYAAELYKRGFAPRVVVAGILIDYNFVAMDKYINDGSINGTMAMRHGVPKKAIYQIWDGTSTYEEVAALKKFMEEKKLKKAILVTSNFHTRRAGWCARKVFKDTEMKLYVTAVPDPYHSLDKWWLAENDMITVFTEYLKFIYYILKYR